MPCTWAFLKSIHTAWHAAAMLVFARYLMVAVALACMRALTSNVPVKEPVSSPLWYAYDLSTDRLFEYSPS